MKKFLIDFCIIFTIIFTTLHTIKFVCDFFFLERKEDVKEIEEINAKGMQILIEEANKP